MSEQEQAVWNMVFAIAVSESLTWPGTETAAARADLAVRLLRERQARVPSTGCEVSR